jgi:hypothetical protein
MIVLPSGMNKNMNSENDGGVVVNVGSVGNIPEDTQETEKTTDTTSSSDSQESSSPEYVQLTELKRELSDVRAGIERAEQDGRRREGFLMAIVSGIGIAFFLAFVMISLDYFRYNRDADEDMENRIQGLRKEFISREEGSALLEQVDKVVQSEIKAQLLENSTK